MWKTGRLLRRYMTKRGVRILGTMLSLVLLLVGLALQPDMVDMDPFLTSPTIEIERVPLSVKASVPRESEKQLAEEIVLLPSTPTSAILPERGDLLAKEAPPVFSPPDSFLPVATVTPAASVSPVTFSNLLTEPTPSRELNSIPPTPSIRDIFTPTPTPTLETSKNTEYIAAIASPPMTVAGVPSLFSLSGEMVTAHAIIGANVRAGPGQEYPVINTLEARESVALTGYRDNWFEVSQGRKRLGWVYGEMLQTSNDLDLASLPSPVVAESENDRLNRFDAITLRTVHIHDKPERNSNIVVRNVPLVAGFYVIGRDESGEWVLVGDTLGAVGWVEATSLRFAPGIVLEMLPDRSPRETSLLWAEMQFGGQTHHFDNYKLMSTLGMGWVKIQYKWHVNAQPEHVADRIQQAHERGFKILLSIPGEYYPTSIDFEAYVEFLAGVAALPDPPDAIEVWNEMNIDAEWPVGEISPESYVSRMLAPAYMAIKGVDPNIVVISGAPAPTGFNNRMNAWSDDRYVMGMVRAGAADYVDCVGVHYNAGATSPYAVEGHPAGNYYGWYFEPHMSTYYRAFGEEKPLCITEIGYLTGDDYGPLPDRFWWASETSLEEQGLWFAEARRYAQELGYIQMMIVFSVDILHWTDDDPQSGYALIRKLDECPSCAFLRD